MTTPLHNADQSLWQYCAADWISGDQVSSREMRELCIASNTLFKFGDGPYVGQTKAPNMAVREHKANLPQIVFESGWSESLSQLRNDMRRWITGGNGGVKIVILIKWRRVGVDGVAGEVEVWRLARDGTPQLREIQTVFPAGPAHLTQEVTLTRGTIWGRGAVIDADHGRGDVLSMPIRHLRRAAESEMRLMGLKPL